MVKTLFSSVIQILIFVLLFCPQNSFAQNIFSLGVKGGLIYNQYIISGDAVSEFGSDFRTGSAIGISSEIKSSNHFMLMTELYYLQRGMSYKGAEFNNFPNGGKTSVSSLSFMILPAYKFNLKFISPFIFAGPRIEQRLSYDDGGIPYFYNYLNNFNFGFSAGLGFEKALTEKFDITADLRYSRDFTNFRRVYTVDGQFADYTNSSFDFFLGLNFNFGKNKN